MRILFVSNYYPPYEVGGYEQLCQDVVHRLTQRGHTTAVLASNRGLDHNRINKDPNVYRLLKIQPDYSSWMNPALQFFLTRRKVEAYNRRVLHKAIEQFHPDVVFIWNLEGLPYELAMDTEDYPGVAVAYWLAHYSPAQPDSFWHYWDQQPGKRVSLEIFKRVLRWIAIAQMQREGKPVHPRMQQVGVVSAYMRNRGLSEGTLPVHTQIIPNGVEVDDFYREIPQPGTTNRPISLLVAGRVSPDKGVHVAIEAAFQLSQQYTHHDFRLIVAGDGPADYMEYLQDLVTKYHLEDRVTFIGWIPRSQMPELMHQCHVLLLTATFPEAFARVVLEAMAAGLAVVGTLTGGTGELLQDGINGLTFAAEDCSGLAHQIGQLLDNPYLRYQIASQGQKTVLEYYTLEHMVERVENLLELAILEQKRI